jgi:crossover junction endodeoxyribonuclease RusA
MKLVLPYPPSINHYFCRKRDGNMYIGDRGVEYRLAVKLAVVQAGIKPLKDCGLSMIVHLFVPDLRKRDIDNPMKCLLDALTHGGAIVDDSRIAELMIYKHAPSSDDDGGKSIVLIEGVGGDACMVKRTGAWLV